jgi:hypothetical protein
VVSLASSTSPFDMYIKSSSAVDETNADESTNYHFS